MSDCEVCKEDKVCLNVCSECSNEADDRLRKEQRHLGAKQEQNNILKFYNENLKFWREGRMPAERIINFIQKKRLKELE